MRKITSAKYVEVVVKDGTTKQMVEITRIDTEDAVFSEVERVEKDSIYDPLSKNYNEKLDAE